MKSSSERMAGCGVTVNQGAMCDDKWTHQNNRKQWVWLIRLLVSVPLILFNDALSKPGLVGIWVDQKYRLGVPPNARSCVQRLPAAYVLCRPWTFLFWWYHHVRTESAQMCALFALSVRVNSLSEGVCALLSVLFACLLLIAVLRWYCMIS